mmetsp:Transcript_32967/g.71348  ORF Transcript_32967/g.71348 Transcript_32967/m.71348 type:complete len:135 (-) Transcript_32967:1462-1866(-)
MDTITTRNALTRRNAITTAESTTTTGVAQDAESTTKTTSPNPVTTDGDGSGVAYDYGGDDYDGAHDDDRRRMKKLDWQQKRRLLLNLLGSDANFVRNTGISSNINQEKTRSNGKRETDLENTLESRFLASQPEP